MSPEVCRVVNRIGQFVYYIFLKVHTAHGFRHLNVIAVLRAVGFCRNQFLFVFVGIGYLVHHQNIMS